MTGELAEYGRCIRMVNRLLPFVSRDEFKVIYNEKSVEGIPYGIDGISSIWFKHQDREFYAFRYALDDEGEKMGFFNENGKEMRRPFLMAPLSIQELAQVIAEDVFILFRKDGKRI